VEETDLIALQEGYMTLTPLDFDLTKRPVMDQMKQWSWKLEN